MVVNLSQEAKVNLGAAHSEVFAGASSHRTAEQSGAGSLLDRIGWTPLVRLERATRHFSHVEILAKAEWFNPGGSVKDRPAYAMILDAERDGRLTPAKTLLDATSGNTGIAYAMIGAAKGYRVKLCVPTSASQERKRILAAYGAEIVWTPAGEGSDGAIRQARQIYAEDPDRYFYCDQYNNPANWRAHYCSTAVEIWQQARGRLTHFVAGLGTTGTFVGTARRLQELDPSIRFVSFQPDAAFHGLEGLKHLPTSIVPGIYDPGLASENLWIQTEDAYEQVRRLAREEGLLVGVSSGAALAACLQIAQSIPPGESARIVTVFPDSGERYLEERFWEENK